MSHIQQMNYVEASKKQFPDNFINSRVLEVGSLNINGTIRTYFENCEYIGIDLGPGNCVDIICSGSKYDDHILYDTVASCECFEHNPEWVETFANMHRLCKKDGLIFMTCATTGRPEHGTSRTSPANSPLTIAQGWDYYRNLTEDDFRNNFDLNQMFSEFKFDRNISSCDLYFCGIKR